MIFTLFLFTFIFAHCAVFSDGADSIWGRQWPLPVIHKRTRGLTTVEIKDILDEHNRLRRRVLASNMHKLQWDSDLARTAQIHADRCRFEHSKLAELIGENIWAAQYVKFSISEAVEDWYNEKKNGSCQCMDTFSDCCGHYAQVMWAETNKVGCGYNICSQVYDGWGRHHLLVCQYSPPGNMVRITENGDYVRLPIFVKRADGEIECKACSSGSVCEDGLCV